MQNLRNESMERLLRAILELKNTDECFAFFRDLCTIKELQDMCRRFDTALLLDQDYSYQKISAQVGVSTATIGRVNQCLLYGAGGYRMAIDRLAEGGERDEDQ